MLAIIVKDIGEFFQPVDPQVGAICIKAQIKSFGGVGRKEQLACAITGIGTAAVNQSSG